MSELGTDGATDLQVIEEILAAVAGRPRLAPVAAAASALAAELGTARPEPITPDRGAPPGTVPDVDVPQVTKPRIDQPLGDPPPGAPLGGTVPGIIDAELVDDLPVGTAYGSGAVSAPIGDFTDSGGADVGRCARQGGTAIGYSRRCGGVGP